MDKQFLLFTYYNYYPNGGSGDACSETFDTIEQAISEAKNQLISEYSYFDVYDRINGVWIYKKTFADKYFKDNP